MTLDELKLSHPAQMGLAFILQEPTVDGLVLVIPSIAHYADAGLRLPEKPHIHRFYQVYEELKSEPGVYVGTGILTDEERDSVDWEAFGYIRLPKSGRELTSFHAQEIVKL